MLELTRIGKVFNAGKHNEHAAIRNISLGIEANRVTVLKGASGSGKTTLLGIMGCMARPTSGRMKIHGLQLPGFSEDSSAGVEVTSLPERFLTEIRRRTFGFIFQQFHLIKGITVLENIMLPAYPFGEPYRALRQRAMHLVEMFNLSRQESSRVEWLSGGEAQRVAICRALMNDPAVIIADEPTAHLDTELSRDFMGIVARFKGEGKTTLIASHDPLVYESPVVDRVINLRDGRLEG